MYANVYAVREGHRTKCKKILQTLKKKSSKIIRQYLVDNTERKPLLGDKKRPKSSV
jgi:hypothetical protein